MKCAQANGDLLVSRGGQRLIGGFCLSRSEVLILSDKIRATALAEEVSKCSSQRAKLVSTRRAPCERVGDPVWASFQSIAGRVIRRTELSLTLGLTLTGGLHILCNKDDVPPKLLKPLYTGEARSIRQAAATRQKKGRKSERRSAFNLDEAESALKNLVPASRFELLTPRV